MKMKYLTTLLVLFSLAFNAWGQDKAEKEIEKKGVEGERWREEGGRR